MNSNSLTALRKTHLFSYRLGAGWTCGSSAKAFTSNLNGSYAGKGQHCMGFLYAWSQGSCGKTFIHRFFSVVFSLSDSVYYN